MKDSSLPPSSPPRSTSLAPSSPPRDSSLPPSSPIKESSPPPSSPPGLMSVVSVSPVGLRASTPGFERDVTVFEESEEVEILREETPMTVRESLPPSSPLTERDVDVDVDVIDVVEDVVENDEVEVDVDEMQEGEVRPVMSRLRSRTPVAVIRAVSPVEHELGLTVVSSRASYPLDSPPRSPVAFAQSHRAPSFPISSRAFSPLSSPVHSPLSSRAPSRAPSPPAADEDVDVDIKYDPTENDLLSSPLSPAPSSPTPSSATAVVLDEDDKEETEESVLPVLVAPPEVDAMDVDISADVEVEVRGERKRSLPVEEEDEAKVQTKKRRLSSPVLRSVSPPLRRQSIATTSTSTRVSVQPERDDEDDEEEEDAEEGEGDVEEEVVSPRRRKPRPSGGRGKARRKPRTSEFVVLSDEEDEETVVRGVSIAETVVKVEQKEMEKKRKATSPPPASDDEEEEEEEPRPPKKRGRKKQHRTPSPSPAPSLAASLAPSDSAPARKRRGGGGSRKRAAKDKDKEDAAIERIEWARESPMPLVELEGMVIETLATARATSMSCEAIWRALMSGRPGLKGKLRRCCVPSVQGEGETETGATEQKGEERIEERPMGKQDWLQLLTHILTTGHAVTGLFGRVESSASDSDTPLSPHASPLKASAHPHHLLAPMRPRKKLTFKAAIRAQWYYVPERDTDGERAALVKSMMRGPGKRSETMKYKQYYWKPLGKITRWDREDDL